MTTPTEYVCVICNQIVSETQRRTHLDTNNKHAQVKLFLEAHNNNRSLADAKRSVRDNDYRCVVCSQNLTTGKKPKMEVIDKHVREGGHVKAVQSSWATFQDASRRVNLVRRGFPDSTLQQNFNPNNEEPPSPTDGGPVRQSQKRVGNGSTRKTPPAPVYIGELDVMRAQATGTLGPGNDEIRFDDSPRMGEDHSCATSPLGPSKKRKAEEKWMRPYLAQN